ncbi:MAG: hypothetical protein ACO31Z_03520 [Litorivicinaceae bacterium]
MDKGLNLALALLSFGLLAASIGILIVNVNAWDLRIVGIMAIVACAFDFSRSIRRNEQH